VAVLPVTSLSRSVSAPWSLNRPPPTDAAPPATVSELRVNLPVAAMCHSRKAGAPALRTICAPFPLTTVELLTTGSAVSSMSAVPME
jgi:hypothetical protein